MTGEDYNSGAPAMARAINRGYLDARMTSYINWPLVAAMPSNLPWPTMGLMTAGQPWSGAYVLGEQLWVSAHTTQFTRPGWSFIDKSDARGRSPVHPVDDERRVQGRRAEPGAGAAGPALPRELRQRRRRRAGAAVERPGGRVRDRALRRRSRREITQVSTDSGQSQ
jgi:hypothetical protein